MRSSRLQQSKPVTGVSVARVEALEPRKLLSGTGIGETAAVASTAARHAVAAKAVRIVPDPNLLVFVDDRRLPKNGVINFGTLPQGSAPVTKVVEIRTVGGAVPFKTVTAHVPDARYTATLVPTTRGYQVTVTFDPAAPGVARGPIYYPTAFDTQATFNVTATVLPPATVQLAKVSVLRAPQRNGQVKPAPGIASVRFVNPGTFKLSGPIELQLFASKELVLGPDDVLVATRRQGLALAKGASTDVPVSFTYPAVTQTEGYYLIARATGNAVLAGGVGAAAEPVQRTVEPATLNLAGVGTTAPAVSTSTGRNRVIIPVENFGTLNARGTRINVDLFVSPTPAADPATLVPLASYRNLAVTPRARTQSYQVVTPRLPASLPAGGSSFYLLARITGITVPKNLQPYDASVVPGAFFAVR